MRWIGFLLLLVAVAACSSVPIVGTGGPETHVRRAIDAAGGGDALGTVHTVRVQAEGTWLKQPYTADSHFRRPEDWRWEMKSEGMSMIGWVLGEEHTVYMSAGGPAMIQEGEAREEWLQHMRVSFAVLLPDRLLEPDVALEDAGSVPVGDDECPAVRARFGGGRPVTFAFDPETHRIRRVLFEMTDPQKGKRLPVVMDVSGWDEVEDIQVPHEVRMVWGEGDEVQMIEERYTDVQWNPPIADEVLAAPETAAPPEVSVKEVAETRVVEHTFVGPYQDVGDGIQAAMQWIGQNGGEVAGGVTLLYREPPNPEDFARSKTVIQVPVRMAGKTVPGEMRLLRRPAFQFAYAPYEGHASGCHLLMQAVLDWCKQNGYEPMPRRPMPYFRVTYLKMDPQTGQCTAEVGYPVGKRAE